MYGFYWVVVISGISTPLPILPSADSYDFIGNNNEIFIVVEGASLSTI